MVRAGRLDEARDLQRRLTPLAGLVTSMYGVPGLKAAVSLLGFAGGDPCPPLRPVGDAAIEDIRQALDRLHVPVG